MFSFKGNPKKYLTEIQMRVPMRSRVCPQTRGPERNGLNLEKSLQPARRQVYVVRLFAVAAADDSHDLALPRRLGTDAATGDYSAMATGISIIGESPSGVRSSSSLSWNAW